MGVMGGMYFGLRKEYKRDMTTVVTDTSKDWNVPGIISSNFTQVPSTNEEMP